MKTSNKTYTFSNGKGAMVNYYHTIIELGGAGAYFSKNVVVGIGSVGGLTMANKVIHLNGATGLTAGWHEWLPEY